MDDQTSAATAAPPTAARLPQTFDEYRASRAGIFPSDHALDWFARRWRDELVAAGAMVRINRRLFVVPERFDAVVLEVGARLVAEVPVA